MTSILGLGGSVLRIAGPDKGYREGVKASHFVDVLYVSPPELLHDPRQVAALHPSGLVVGLPVVEALDDLGQILAEDELGHADVVAVVAQDGEELHHAQGVAALLEKGPEIRTWLDGILYHVRLMVQGDHGGLRPRLDRLRFVKFPWLVGRY